VAAEEEVEELAAADDGASFLALVDRRCVGEPLAWVTGVTTFCGLSLFVDQGVYVPRWQSEPLAEQAAHLLPPEGRAIDVGTGSGALARVLAERRPGASILGTELDPVATRCAVRNGVEVVAGDLFEQVPVSWQRQVDVIVGVLPYVPTDQMSFLPRDVQDFEPRDALDGGTDGLHFVGRAIEESPQWLRPGGHLLLEVGGDQPDLLIPRLRSAGFVTITTLMDEENDPRGIAATMGDL
jgi:release factor glutamine methyltransferase